MISQLVFEREKSSAFSEMLQILGASLFLAIVAQIEIQLPFTPVPITMQTFGALAVGAVLGSRKGALAALCYLAESSMGLPVLAGGTMNPFWILCPSAGYLVGMVPMAFFTGWFYERFARFSHLTLLAATTVISFAHLAFGTLWLGQLFVGWEHALQMGFYPFVPGSVLKIIGLNLSFAACKRS